jgi:hypothetical protein
MSKRTLRRAAERQAHKAERPQHSTVHPVAEPEAAVAVPLAAEPQPASPAQIAANRENAKLSTGPSSPEGKAAVAQNRRSHGLTGSFTVLAWENGADFESLIKITWAEYQPQTPTEHRLVHSLIQHYWLTQRAIRLQENLFETGDPAALDGKQLSLFLRYQTTNERSYYKAERELKNLRKERGQAEIGFESQKRRLESHEARVRLAHARSVNLEIDAACRKVMEAPIPGNTTIPFADLAKACSTAIANLVYQNQQNAAGA